MLVTPLARNSWKDAAHYNDFLADFADAVLTLGKAENVMVLDLHTWAMALMQQDGLETAKRWFYPGDYTHTNDFGAYKMAGFVAHALGDALGLMVTDARSGRRHRRLYRWKLLQTARFLRRKAIPLPITMPPAPTIR